MVKVWHSALISATSQLLEKQTFFPIISISKRKQLQKFLRNQKTNFTGGFDQSRKKKKAAIWTRGEKSKFLKESIHEYAISEHFVPLRKEKTRALPYFSPEFFFCNLNGALSNVGLTSYLMLHEKICIPCVFVDIFVRPVPHRCARPVAVWVIDFFWKVFILYILQRIFFCFSIIHDVFFLRQCWSDDLSSGISNSNISWPSISYMCKLQNFWSRFGAVGIAMDFFCLEFLHCISNKCALLKKKWTVVLLLFICTTIKSPNSGSLLARSVAH